MYGTTPKLACRIIASIYSTGEAVSAVSIHICKLSPLVNIGVYAPKVGRACLLLSYYLHRKKICNCGEFGAFDVSGRGKEKPLLAKSILKESYDYGKEVLAVFVGKLASLRLMLVSLIPNLNPCCQIGG